MPQAHIDNFDRWRRAARAFLAAEIQPHDITWQDLKDDQAGLFTSEHGLPVSDIINKVPREFVALAKIISCHSDVEKWNILYTALWRITHGEKFLFAISADKLVRKLHVMEKSIKFDAHKTKAFVRFRRCEDELGEHFIAWHNPDHYVLQLVAPFFKRRFNDMRLTIFTPHESVTYDGEELISGGGIPAGEAPAPDVLEDMWRAYYRATFNPARVKIKAMKKEMPVRHWATLPETEIIRDLLKEAPKRVEKMIEVAEKNLG